MENRIAELKHDLAPMIFVCGVLRHEAAFRSILLLFNLLGEFSALPLPQLSPARHTARQIFLCGALLGRAAPLGPALSTSWGGLQQRIPLLETS